MRSVGIPIVLREFRSREKSDFTTETNEPPTVFNRSKIKFPLTSHSKDHIQDRDLEFAKFLTEDDKVYLRLLNLSSSIEPAKYINLEGNTISPNVTNKLDRTQGAAPLHYASMNGNLPLVAFLLENGAEADIWDSNQRVTPLACAAAHGHLEIVKILLEQDCNVNAGLNSTNNDQSSSPLLWAVRKKHAHVVRYLLEHNACQNSSVPFSQTPIHAAVIAGSPEILEMLIRAQGASVKTDFQMGPEKDTALHLAASGDYENSFELCKILVEQANVGINAVNSKEQSPLHAATGSLDVNIIKMLLSRGARVNAVDQWGKTPIFYMIGDTQEALECLEAMIKLGKCDVNRQDKEGYTALHLAGIYGATGAAELLLMNGADFSIKANGDTTALSILRKNMVGLNTLLHKVFDQAVTVTDFTETSSSTTAKREECEVEVDFRCTLPCTPTESPCQLANEEKTKAKRTVSSGFSRMASMFKEEEDDTDPRKSQRKETSKIKCLIDEEQTGLLLHPVVHSFLQLKWHKARLAFLPTLLCKAILIILFSAYIQMPYAMNKHLTDDFNLTSSNYNASRNMSVVSDGISVIQPERTPVWFKAMYAVIVTMAFLRGIMELLQILRAPKSQLRTLHPWISFAVLLIMVFYMRPKTWKRAQDPFRRSMASLCILLAWIDIWIEMGRFPKIGQSIRVFHRVLKNFCLFILPHCCLLVGFILSFTVLFPQNGEFRSVTMALTKIIRVMAGDITIAGEGVKIFTPDHSPREIFAHILLVYIYTAYVLIVAIVLMNMLVGLAVNDLQGIYAEASIDKLVKQTILLNTLESSLNRKWIRSLLPERVFSKYLNLFEPSSSNKTLTFKPYDSRDQKLESHHKNALLKIGSANRVNDTVKCQSEALAHSSVSRSSKNIRLWKNAASELRRSTSNEDEEKRELMEKINQLLATYLEKKKV